ncbi:unnamed protein product [Psylliodes chrysocephalus]|uniref:Uncharacterized protein n=1 Tax=Psylliodes chrysocephalus TaxID=3402493 RepID=A0A9P0D6R9_9CUCU|nr:unnamed protein product [Psylliodes chrysocephala]
MFYYRQLWLYGFEIHDLKMDQGHFYTYHEGQAAKGPNEVGTIINDYVQKMSAEIQELYIFSNGCLGQNCNNTVVRYLLALASSKRFRKFIITSQYVVALFCHVTETSVVCDK